jgi:hypothetical protein
MSGRWRAVAPSTELAGEAGWLVQPYPMPPPAPMAIGAGVVPWGERRPCLGQFSACCPRTNSAYWLRNSDPDKSNCGEKVEPNELAGSLVVVGVLDWKIGCLENVG